MTHVFTDPDLIALDAIWPMGRELSMRPDGVAIVAGAYRGRYLHYLNNRFPTSNLVGYEPQSSLFPDLSERFIDYPKIKLYNAALGIVDGKSNLGDCGTDGASFFSRDGKSETVQLVNAARVLRNEAIGGVIDILLLNMEGYEWVLLPYLLHQKDLPQIRSMAIQFHPKFVSNEAVEEVLSMLGRFFERDRWDYPSWTLWRNKNADLTE